MALAKWIAASGDENAVRPKTCACAEAFHKGIANLSFVTIDNNMSDSSTNSAILVLRDPAHPCGRFLLTINFSPHCVFAMS